MIASARRIIAPFASLKLTIVLLGMAMVLIFAGTLAQLHHGIWHVMRDYFQSLWVWIPFQIFMPRHRAVGGGVPWPGGSLLGGALLVNLLAAHAVRFKLRLKRSGIFLIHAALILLLVGEGVTSFTAVETQMPIFEGQSVRWSQDIRTSELAVIDTSDPDHDTVVAIPQARLKQAARTGKAITNKAMPLAIRVDRFMVNSAITRRRPKDPVPPQATGGIGRRYEAIDKPEVTGVGDQMVNLPSAIITVRDRGTGRSLGRYLVSTNLESSPNVNLRQAIALPGASKSEKATSGGGRWQVCLRMRRHYKPYTITLNDFHHDLYPGTDIPSNYASDIRIDDPTRHVDREVKIHMNHPLRYAGQTFYQASFMPGDKGTVLQVVNNPAWTVPYIACAMGALGLLIQFGISLVNFLTRRHKRLEKAEQQGGAAA